LVFLLTEDYRLCALGWQPLPYEQKREHYVTQAARKPDGEEQKQEDNKKQNPVYCFA